MIEPSYEYLQTSRALPLGSATAETLLPPAPGYRLHKVQVVSLEYATYPGSTPTPPVPYQVLIWEKITYKDNDESETPS